MKCKYHLCDKSAEEFCSKSHRNSYNVLHRRKKVKAMAAEYMGGRCEMCGYDKCLDALHFHHPDDNKDFSISHAGDTAAWDKIRAELDKCVMICANCHAEEHAQEHMHKYDWERVFDFEMTPDGVELRPKKQYVSCIGCDATIPSTNKTQRCIECFEMPKKTEWPEAEVIIESVRLTGWSATGRMLGVSDNAVRKHLRRNGVDITKVIT